MSKLNPLLENAYKVIDGAELNRNDAVKLLALGWEDTMDLASLANKVRLKFCKSGFLTCEITNAKSGACSENCSFCAQSSANKTDIDIYPLKPLKSILQDALNAKSNGADAFCIVLSGYGYETPDKDFYKLCETVRIIRKETAMEVHVSPGILSRETASMLAEAGVSMVNHNLESAASFYEKICTTHSIQKRIDTVKNVKAAGMRACCGGIIGLGESAADLVELAFTLKDLKVDIIPLNVLRKIEGIRTASAEPEIRFIVNAVAVFRLINKERIIKIAAGRETILSDYQGLIFHGGANAMIIGGYLTLRGRSVNEDEKLLKSI